MDALAIDRAFAVAWPAPEAEWHDGWLLRAAGAITRRANSALALGHVDDLDARLTAVAAWYAARGLPPRVQLGAEAHRLGLVEAVEARGWATGDGACRILALPVPPAPATAPDVPTVEARDRADDEWFRTMWSLSPRVGDAARERLRDIVGRIAAPARFTRALEVDGTSVACALGVVAEGLLVVESVATRPAERRRGHATTLTGDLLAWAAGLGAAQAVLAVEQASPAALAFWQARGFREVSAWTYAQPAG